MSEPQITDDGHHVVINGRATDDQRRARWQADVAVPGYDRR